MVTKTHKIQYFSRCTKTALLEKKKAQTEGTTVSGRVNGLSHPTLRTKLGKVNKINAQIICLHSNDFFKLRCINTGYKDVTFGSISVYLSIYKSLYTISMFCIYFLYNKLSQGLPIPSPRFPCRFLATLGQKSRERPI